MQTSIKRWYIGHRVLSPFDTTTIPFSLVWIFLVNHFRSFICAIRPIYTTFYTVIVFNINICRFYSSRPVFYINNMLGEEWLHSNAVATAFQNSIWCQPPSLSLILLLISNLTDAFYIKWATSSPSLVRIGQIVKEWQQFSKFKMAAAAILNSDESAFSTWLLCFILNLQDSYQIWCGLV